MIRVITGFLPWFALCTLSLALLAGCDTATCEDLCEDEWLDECQNCAEDPVLLESECAEIWCG